MQKYTQYISSQNLSYLLYFIANNLFVFGLMFGGENNKLGYAGVGMWRGIAMVIIAIPMHKLNKLSFAFKDHIEFRKLLLRNTLCGIQSFALALALLYISTPIAHTIVNSGPLCIFVADYFMNGVSIKKKQIVGLILATIGIVLTVNIDTISSIMGISVSHQSSFDYQKSSKMSNLMIILFLVVSTFLWSIGMVQTKNLKSDSFAITFHIGVMLVLANGVAMLFGGIKSDNWSLMQIMWDFVAVGMTLGLSNLLQTISVKLQKKTGNATMVGFWSVILGYILSVFRYNQKISPVGITGSILIFVGLIVALYK